MDGEPPLLSSRGAGWSLCDATAARNWAISQSLLHAVLLATISITLCLNLDMVGAALELNSALVWFVIVPYMGINLLLILVSGVIAVRQYRSRYPSMLVSKRVRQKRFAALWELLSYVVGIFNLTIASILGYHAAELMSTAVVNSLGDEPVVVLVLLAITVALFGLDVFAAMTAGSLRRSLREPIMAKASPKKFLLA